jgi:hypothetical protein
MVFMLSFAMFSLIAQASAAKTAVGLVVVLIGVSLGILAVVFPSARKSPTGEEEDPKKKKSAKGKK